MKKKIVYLLVILVAILGCKDDEVNTVPIALFSFTPSNATVGEEVTFTDQSGDAEGTIASWSWDFGDGNTSAEQNPKHVYTESGTFKITLVVTDESNESGSYSEDIVIDAFKLNWVYEIGTNISPSSAALGADGTIYIGSQDFKLYAFNPDGTKKWDFETGDKVRSTPAVGADGTIYVASLDDKLYAVSPSGSKQWEFVTGANIFLASPAIGGDGTVYIGSDDMKFYAINPDGSKKWEFEADNKIRSSAAIASNGTLYVGSLGGMLYALNADGSKKWEYQAGAKIEADPALGADGSIYFGAGDGVFYALNSDGSEKWKFNTVDSNPITGSAAIGEDGSIYFGTKVGALGSGPVIYALNSNGSEKWKIVLDIDSETTTSVVLTCPTIGMNGTIYIGSFNGYMYALNPDGTVKFEYKVKTDDPTNKWDQPIWSSPALSDDGVLYFGDYSGNVYSIQVAADGLAGSSWATRGKNNQRTHK